MQQRQSNVCWVPVIIVHCWLYGICGSLCALDWIRGSYTQFVRNRVPKIQMKCYMQCRHVRSEENPADL